MAATWEARLTELTTSRHAARVGAAFELALGSNPSTGYRWEIDRAASSGLDLIGIEELPAGRPAAARDAPPLAGAPSDQRWRITARARGPAKLVLVYRRVWETVAPVKRHDATIDIAG